MNLHICVNKHEWFEVQLVFIMCSPQEVTGAPLCLLTCSHCILLLVKDYKNTCGLTTKKFSHLPFHFSSASQITLTITAICGPSLSKTLHKHL
jgi:hypothetical protein